MKKVWNIYYGTRGSAGAYIDALQSACAKAKVNSWAFVSFNYTFKSWQVIKCFFPLTDYTEYKSWLIRYIRGVELTIAYFLIWITALFVRPIINLHYTNDYWLNYIFFRACKFAGFTVYITGHEVVPREDDKPIALRRLTILNNTDKIIVHSMRAERFLKQNLKVSNGKITRFPFPWTSYDIILDESKMEIAKTKIANILDMSRPWFLFIGYVRKAKGIELLWDTWHSNVKNTNAGLIIAGKWPKDLSYIKKKYEDDNVILFDERVSDEEFVALIQLSTFVILPYLDYSHSSILFSCAYHNGAVIVSNIELFKEILGSYRMTFNKGDSRELGQLMKKAACCTNDELLQYQKELRNAIENYQKGLVKALREVFNVDI